jgi:DNA topoisomerase-3
MEESAIREGFEHLKPGSDYKHLYESALARQKADWLIGINGTRLFTVLYNSKVLKVGRVQTPTLAMLVDRESEIMNFKKKQYFKVHITEKNVDAVTVEVESREEADRIAAACNNGQAKVISIKKEEKNTAPPKLYDLTTLQRDANRIFGLTAKQTLEYTQILYEKKLATYPRTDSRYLTEDMEQTALRVISAIEKTGICGNLKAENPDIKRIMNSKKVSDHHAIIPTVEIGRAVPNSLSVGERYILTLLCSSLFYATGHKHTYETVKAEIECAGYKFETTGRHIKEMGWKAYEEEMKKVLKTSSSKPDEELNELPKLTEGQILGNVKSFVSEHYTSAPKRYTEDSLLSAMERAGATDMDDEVERKGLGTPATRADIIEKLVKDGFVKREKKQMVPTDDGMKLITVLPEVLKSPKLTADWENELVRVSKGELDVDLFMRGIEDMVRTLVAQYSAVSEKDKNMFSSKYAIGKCPKCGSDVANGKYGVYCTGKCGMSLGMAFGVKLSEAQVKSLLAGKKILVKGLRSKQNRIYDAYLKPEGIVPYEYSDAKGGKHSGYQYKFEVDYPKK